MEQYFHISEESLRELYQSVQGSMSEKRFRHTAAVADMVVRLAALYCPEKKDMLMAAALLHDITKEWGKDTQEMFLQNHGEVVTETEKLAPKTYHARTAALLIPEKYPMFAQGEILSYVRYHTTGRAQMTLGEKLVYLADYIDDTRTFPDCVALRTAFWSKDLCGMTQEEKLIHLDDVMILAFDMTFQGLVQEGVPVHPDTMLARNYLLVEKAKRSI